MRVCKKFLLMFITPWVYAWFGFMGGLFAPWEDLCMYSDEYGKMYNSKFYWSSIPGRLLGMLVMGSMFLVSGFMYGLVYPWLNDRTKINIKENI